MIYKSYLIEENINLLKGNIILFYGENLGLINELKESIEIKYKSKKVIKITQDDILKNQDLIFNEVKNISLFEDEKIIFISEVNDNILKIILEIHPSVDKNKIFMFGNVLDKKSKLRTHFEKSKDFSLVACYKDNDISIKKLITNKLKGFSGLTPKILNILSENCGLDRMKLNNELNKVKTFFNDKNIEIDQLEKLLNQKTDEDFNSIKDFALKGDNKSTNKLLSSTIFEDEKIPLYLNIINHRLNKLEEASELSNHDSLSKAVEALKPPIFWKDKPNFITQSRLWSKNRIRSAMKKTFDLEIKIKSNTGIKKDILIKKLILDICILANS